MKCEVVESETVAANPTGGNVPKKFHTPDTEKHAPQLNAKSGDDVVEDGKSCICNSRRSSVSFSNCELMVPITPAVEVSASSTTTVFFNFFESYVLRLSKGGVSPDVDLLARTCFVVLQASY